MKVRWLYRSADLRCFNITAGLVQKCTSTRLDQSAETVRQRTAAAITGSAEATEIHDSIQRARSDLEGKRDAIFWEFVQGCNESF